MATWDFTEQPVVLLVNPDHKRPVVRLVLVVLTLASVTLLLAFVSCQTVGTGNGTEWGDPERIDRLEAGALRPQVAIDPMGNSIVVWDQTDPETLEPGMDLDVSDDIWLSRTDGAGSWGTPLRLEDNEPGDSVFPRLGIDGAGNAVVAFLQLQEVQQDPPKEYFRVWAVRYDASNRQPDEAACIQSAASDPTCSELAFSGDAGPPQIAVDDEGNAVVVWHQGGSEDEPSRVWSNRLIAGSGWEGAQELAQSDVSDLLKPAIAMDAEGSVIAVWERLDRDNLRTSISSSRYRVQTGEWDDPQFVEVDDGNAFDPRVASDAEGNAISVWVQEETIGGPFLVRASRYLASTRMWEPPELIGPENAGAAEAPRIAIDGEGNATAVWVQTEAALAGAWSNRYEAGAGWGTAKPIGPTALGPARTPQVAVSAPGDAVAVWVQFDIVQDSIWSNRYRPGSGWRASGAVELANDVRASGPAVAVDVQGNATAVWMVSTSADPINPDLVANRLNGGSTESDTR